PNAAYFVVENEQGAIVGGVGIAPFDTGEGICELQKLYVIPGAQGNGLAKQLMKTALEFAGQHYTYCYLETSTELKEATGLYMKLEFQALEKPLGNSGHNAMDTWLIKALD